MKGCSSQSHATDTEWSIAAWMGDTQFTHGVVTGARHMDRSLIVHESVAVTEQELTNRCGVVTHGTQIEKLWK